MGRSTAEDPKPEGAQLPPLHPQPSRELCSRVTACPQRRPACPSTARPLADAKEFDPKNPSMSSLPFVPSRPGVNGHGQHFLAGSPGVGLRHGGVLWKGQAECGWHRPAGGGDGESEGSQGSPAACQGRGSRLCAHAALSASCEAHVAFPSRCKMLSTSRSAACGVLSVTTLNPLVWGKSHPARGRDAASGNRGRNSTRGWSRARARSFSRELPSAERAGRTWELPAEARRVRISPDVPDPEAIAGVAAGLTKSRGSAQTQHPAVTGLCPAPPTPHWCLEGSDLALGSHRSSPVSKPAVQPSPRATEAAQPRCHCTSSRSVPTRRDKDGHSDGELTLPSPRLPAQLTPSSRLGTTQGKPALTP